jgi:hypothetical protein
VDPEPDFKGYSREGGGPDDFFEAQAISDLEPGKILLGTSRSRMIAGPQFRKQIVWDKIDV